MKSLIDEFDVYNINLNREILDNEKERYLKDVYGVSTVNINDRQNMNIFYNKILTCKWADGNLGRYSIYSDYDVIQKRSIVGFGMRRLVLDCEHGKHYIPQEILKRYGIVKGMKKYYWSVFMFENGSGVIDEWESIYMDMYNRFDYDVGFFDQYALSIIYEKMGRLKIEWEYFHHYSDLQGLYRYIGD